MHNIIHELKGNILVFCRQRRIIPSDGIWVWSHLIAVNDHTLEVHILNKNGNQLIMSTPRTPASGKYEGKKNLLV
jgi:hypothetical protein